MGWYNEIKAPAALFVKNSDEPVPLKLVEYHAKVTDGIARITLSQTYKNDNVSFLETVYHFPLSSIGVFVDFEAVYEDKVVKGKIKEKTEAKKEFNELKSKGHTAAYGEIKEKTQDIMAIELGNLLPEATVVIRLTFVQTLEVSQSKLWKLIIPSTLTPRYTPSVSEHPGTGPEHAKEQKASGANDGLRYSSKLLYPWKITVEIEENPIKAIFSPSHPDSVITVTKEGNTQMSFCKEEFPNKDFSLVYVASDSPGDPRVKLAKCSVSNQADPTYCGMVSLIPDLNDNILDDALMSALEGEEFEPDIMKIPGEFIFFIDRSGSMSGNRIRQAREALQLFIKSFPEDCYFNVYSFGDSYSKMFSESVKYSNETSKSALQRISTMEADMGGTEIFLALKTLFSEKLKENYPRRVFLLTDGDVSNTNSVVSLIESSCDGYSNRLYTIGIGNGCSQDLIRRGAKAGKGSYEFIGDRDDVSGRIIKMLENALLPNITDVKIKFDENDVALATPLPLDGESFSVNSFMTCFFIFTDIFAQKKSTEIEISYKNAVTLGSFTKKLRFDVSNCIRNSDSLHKMAIKRYIDESKARNTQRYQSILTNTTKLALEYQILTEETAFVCLISENSIDKGALKEEKVIIPSIISSDYLEPTKPNPNYYDADSPSSGSLEEEDDDDMQMMVKASPKMAMNIFQPVKLKNASPKPYFKKHAAQTLHLAKSYECYALPPSLPSPSYASSPPPPCPPEALSLKYSDEELEFEEEKQEAVLMDDLMYFKEAEQEKCLELNTPIMEEKIMELQYEKEACQMAIAPLHYTEEAPLQRIEEAVSVPLQRIEEPVRYNVPIEKVLCERKAEEFVSLSKEMACPPMKEEATHSVSLSSQKKVEEEVLLKEKEPKAPLTPILVVSKCDFRPIVNQQQINGKWESSPQLLGSLGVTEAILSSLFPSVVDIHVKITLFILAWLEKIHGNSSSAWVLIKKKAESFLKSNGCKDFSRHVASAKGEFC